MILMGFIIVKAGIVKKKIKVYPKSYVYLIIPCVIINVFRWTILNKTVNGLDCRLLAIRIISGGSPACHFRDGKTVFLNEVEIATISYH